MTKEQNRHDTKKWKKKRKNRHGDRCRKAKCTICHAYKVLGILKKQYRIEPETP